MIAVGQSIGNYTITAKLGEGGMGVVYLAEHVVIGRKVAMKVIHPELSRNQEVVSRFVTEAKSVNQIGHEHVVDISDFGTTPQGEAYFIMEFLQGEALADVLKRERVVQPPRALRIAAQVADALAASHAHGIIHRDLKPENIFLINKGGSTDFVKVLDFGLAKLTQGEEKVTHKTRTGSVMGTPYYMAPEQCEGKANIDHRADVYSLGVILFEMMTGAVPFTGEGYGEIIVKHITAPRPKARSLNPSLSTAHEAILQRALRISREERFRDMAEFRAAMLEPEQYAASAPALSSVPSMGALPVMAADEGVSGQVVFGQGTGASHSAGVRPGPAPTTFRHGTGEIADEAVEVPKSRKGLFVGLVLAAAAAGGAAWFVGMRPTARGPEAAQATPVTESAIPAKPAAQSVSVSVTSEPAGAEVVRREDGKVLGVTPMALVLAEGAAPVQVSIRKDGFEEQQATVTADASKPLLATLVPQTKASEPAPERPEPAVEKATEKDERPSRPARAQAAKPKAAKQPTPAPVKKPANRPVQDEDAVLPPNF